jgi:alpha-galactosidase
MEYSDHGTGDFRSPSFTVIDNCDGSSISPLRYRKHLILRGKLPMPDNLPGIRSTDEKASTLIVTMGDIGSGLEVDLIYVVLHDYDAVMRRAVFRNVDTRTARMGGKAGKVIQRACSFTCDFEYASTPFHMLQLSGSWGI